MVLRTSKKVCTILNKLTKSIKVIILLRVIMQFQPNPIMRSCWHITRKWVSSTWRIKKTHRPLSVRKRPFKSLRLSMGLKISQPWSVTSTLQVILKNKVTKKKLKSSTHNAWKILIKKMLKWRSLMRKMISMVRWTVQKTFLKSWGFSSRDYLVA